MGLKAILFADTLFLNVAMETIVNGTVDADVGANQVAEMDMYNFKAMIYEHLSLVSLL